MLKVWKKSWEPFESCLLNSRANSHHFHLNWDVLAVLFSRQLPNGSHDFFHIFSVFNHLIKNPQTTIALTFLTLNISDIGGVIINRISHQLWNLWGLGVVTINLSLEHFNTNNIASINFAGVWFKPNFYLISRLSSPLPSKDS